MVIDYQAKLTSLAEHYDELAKEFGDSHHAVQQSSRDTQLNRFKILLEGFPNYREKKILDFGCGAAHLYDLLKESGFNGEYIGYDISAELLKIALEKNPNTRFELRDIFKQPPVERFDIILISGVFNNALGDNVRFMQDVLNILFPLCQDGLAFNCLSTYVDYKAEGLFYYDPAEVFAFCKGQLTSSIVLRHDYEIKPSVVPFEFSCYLRKLPHSIRKNNHD